MTVARVNAGDAALCAVVVVAWFAIATAVDRLLERRDARHARRRHPSCGDLR